MFDDLNKYSDEQLERLKKMIDINKMIQETNHNHEINMATIAKMQADTEKLRAETEKLRKAETEKLRAETEKLRKENAWHPWLAIILASIAIVVALLK